MCEIVSFFFISGGYNNDKRDDDEESYNIMDTIHKYDIPL